MRIVVGIPTTGRRDVLAATLGEIARQTRKPDRVLICPTSTADIDQGQFAHLPFETIVVESPRGLPRQRNAILRATGNADIIVFFDDDFLPAPSYLANTVALFSRAPEIVMATGTLIADGINGPGLSPEDGRALLARKSALPVQPAMASESAVTPRYGAYGCNMAIRLAPVNRHSLVFDEKLPLYAWQEDTDFSRRLAPHGTIVQSDALTGVHLGVKGGRTSGVKLGYSQIANPLYLVGKGSMSIGYGARMMVRNVLKNAARTPWPEPYIDRYGRLKGNALALADLIRGRLHPERILSLN